MRRELTVRPPIRVLQLGSPSGMFGAERWILALAKHLPADRVHTTIGAIQDVPGAGTPPLNEHAAALGFETVQIDAPGRLSRGAVSALRELIREHRIDILHTHFYKSTIFGALAVRGARCALLATPHGWNTDAGLNLQLYEWAERLAFGRADAVAPLSEDLERGLRALPWVRSKLTMIPNGVDLAEVTESDDVADEVRAARTDGKFVVGYVGQLIARKRVDTLIDAFAALDLGRKRLFVVGDGPMRDELAACAVRAGVADQVRFTGFRGDRLAYLRGFDALVLPSTLEGIPRCLMEAMAAGVPVVSSDIDGSRDLVCNERTGLLFAVGDALALRRCLARLADEPQLRARLATAAKQRVETDFSAAGMAARYLRLFETVVMRNPRHGVPEDGANRVPVAGSEGQGR